MERSEANIGCIILAEAPSALVQVCGMSLLERLLRTLQRCGIERAAILSSTADIIADHLSQPSWARQQLSVTLAERGNGSLQPEHLLAAWPEDARRCFIVSADVVIDERLLRLILTQESNAALVDSAIPAELNLLTEAAPSGEFGKLCGAMLFDRDWLSRQTRQFDQALTDGLRDGSVRPIDVAAQPTYYKPLRGDLRPFWFCAPSATQQRRAESLILDAAQKRTLDAPALVHAPIETFLISCLCRTNITPNQLTLVTNVAAWTTTLLFATGNLLFGVVLAMLVGVLDGLDGKQARVKVETTKAGKLEHFLDAIFENSWWIALGFYFHSSGQLPGALWYLLLVLISQLVDALAKLRVAIVHKKSIDELAPIDRVIRLVAGRRNIFVWILAAGVFLGAGPKAYVALSWWAAITALVHVCRAIATTSFQRAV